MVEKRGKSVGKLIRQFLLVILAGVLSALVVAGVMLYYFSPTGIYRAANILLSPTVAEDLSYLDVDSTTGRAVRYVFDRVEFLYFDDEERAWSRKQVELYRYRKFYKLISNDESLLVVSDIVSNMFHLDNPAILTLVVSKEGGNHTNEEVKAFQEVQFTNKGDYYRIQLHDADQITNWVYFYHPGIYAQTLQILGS